MEPVILSVCLCSWIFLSSRPTCPSVCACTHTVECLYVVQVALAVRRHLSWLFGSKSNKSTQLAWNWGHILWVIELLVLRGRVWLLQNEISQPKERRREYCRFVPCLSGTVLLTTWGHQRPCVSYEREISISILKTLHSCYRRWPCFQSPIPIV